MTDRPKATLWSTVLDSPDPQRLAVFYEELLGWTRRPGDDATWVTSGPPDGGRPGLAFQLENHYVRPTWPAASGDQQMQVHLDVRVEDVEAVGNFVRGLGAVLAELQPQDDVRVYLDPDGHPFCLFVN